jgi:hypothetical protein
MTVLASPQRGLRDLQLTNLPDTGFGCVSRAGRRFFYVGVDGSAISSSGG